jgi:hypothetical protein
MRPQTFASGRNPILCSDPTTIDHESIFHIFQTRGGQTDPSTARQAEMALDTFSMDKLVACIGSAYILVVISTRYAAHGVAAHVLLAVLPLFICLVALPKYRRTQGWYRRHRTVVILGIKLCLVLARANGRPLTHHQVRLSAPPSGSLLPDLFISFLGTRVYPCNWLKDSAALNSPLRCCRAPAGHRLRTGLAAAALEHMAGATSRRPGKNSKLRAGLQHPCECLPNSLPSWATSTILFQSSLTACLHQTLAVRSPPLGDSQNLPWQNDCKEGTTLM